MPVSSTANSVLWQKQKQKKKIEIYPANKILVLWSLILLSTAHACQERSCSGGLRENVQHVEPGGGGLPQEAFGEKLN